MVIYIGYEKYEDEMDIIYKLEVEYVWFRRQVYIIYTKTIYNTYINNNQSEKRA